MRPTLALCLCLLACGDDDVAVPDAAAPDAAAPDAAAPDAAPSDAAPPDAGIDAAPGGFGVLSGPCDLLNLDNLTSATPSFIRDGSITFAAAYVAADNFDELSPCAQHIYSDPNGGGSSQDSEAFSGEVLCRCELASVEKTEMEIAYSDESGKRTDYLASIDGLQIGVSVTRAYNGTTSYSVAEATTLLTKKLTDIPLSTANVIAPDVWEKQVLHIIAYAPEHAGDLETAWDALDASVKGDTIVLVTVSEGMDSFIY